MHKRPTYRTWLDIAESAPDGTISVLANSDIAFDESIGRLEQLLTERNTFIALSRYEFQSGEVKKHPNPHWSQDTWVVRTGSPFSDLLKDRLDFELGVPRCDNRVAYIFATAGWKIVNPYDQVRSVHFHESNARNYDKKSDTRILGGVAYVHPLVKPGGHSDLEFDIWTLGSPAVRKLSLNHSLERWKASAILKSRNSSHSSDMRDENVDSSCVESSNRTTDLRIAKEVLEHGTELYRDIKANFSVLEGPKHFLIQYGFNPKDWTLLGKNAEELELKFSSVTEAVRKLFAVNDLQIRSKPTCDNDANFWQFPCLTEKQAYDNHWAQESANFMRLGSDNINFYTGLPWATYIDRKVFPKHTLQALVKVVSMLKRIANSCDVSLRCHSVCQHIRWREVYELAPKLGITDLWVSHCTDLATKENATLNSVVDLHPWSLYAVNYCDPARTIGLETGKPMAERKLLASFIGAYMPHYLSDVRVKLCSSIAQLDRNDLLVDLGKIWHFNKSVYDHQVKGKELDDAHLNDLEKSAYRYNQVLSDSKFSLCPAGAGPNTLRFWESIAIGSIPVLFEKNLLLPVAYANELSHLCVYWDQPDQGDELVKHLERFSVAELQARSDRLRDIYSKIEKMTCFK
ncbi:MAG: exostosin family protein [Verrucomicrobiota bacterium]